MMWVEDGHVHGYKLWIGDLPNSFPNHELREALHRICRVDDISCIRAPRCYTGQWCAIVSITCPQDAQAMYEYLKGVKVHGDDGKPRFLLYKWYHGRRH